MDLFFSGENLVGSICEAGSGVRAAGEDVKKNQRKGGVVVRKTVSESLFCEKCVSFLESKWQSDASHCDQLEGEMRKCDFLLKGVFKKQTSRPSKTSRFCFLLKC